MSRVGSDRGFSLLELLIVLLLLGLSAAIVLPSIDRGLRERELKQSVLQLAAVARDLRSRAVYENTIERLLLNPSENSYEVFENNKVVLPSDIRITKIMGGEPVGNGLTQFLFFPNGSILGNEIGISGAQRSAYVIRLDPFLGKVVVLRGNQQ